MPGTPGPAAYAAAMEPVTVERLDVNGARRHRDALAAVLVDCVEGGASVSFMAPFTHDEARGVLRLGRTGHRRRRACAACCVPRRRGGRHRPGRSGLAAEPAAPRATSPSCSSTARRDSRGIGRLLMERAEAEARAAGLDAARARHRHRRSRAERLVRTTWGGTKVGVIPNFALYPDGRPCDTTVFWKALGLGQAAGGA